MPTPIRKAAAKSDGGESATPVSERRSSRRMKSSNQPPKYTENDNSEIDEINDCDSGAAATVIGGEEHQQSPTNSSSSNNVNNNNNNNTRKRKSRSIESQEHEKDQVQQKEKEHETSDTNNAEDDIKPSKRTKHSKNNNNNGNADREKKKRRKSKKDTIPALTLAINMSECDKPDEKSTTPVTGGDGDAVQQTMMSAQEEEDLSSALIAKMLAEEQSAYGQMMMGDYGEDYYEDYTESKNKSSSSRSRTRKRGGSGDDDFDKSSDVDDDWYPNGKPKRSGGGGRKSMGGGASGGGSSKNSKKSQNDNESIRSPNKKSAPAKTEPIPDGQYRSGGYNDDEEQLFLEGLELYGRDWNAISKHIKTRDSKSIRSHAQKHFIKMFRDKIPLPEKVKESGEGYTLSGRPLDPNSAAARPYLQYVMNLGPPKPKEEKKSAGNKDSGGNDKDSKLDGDGSNEKESVDTEEKSSTQEPKTPKTSTNKKQQQQQSQQQQKNGSNKTGSEPKSPTKVNNLSPPIRTEYAINRPKRSSARPKSRGLNQSHHDPHSLVKCAAFSGIPGSTDIPDSQPFKLQVHTNAQLQMDFHAHLVQTEIIGLLGGRWDTSSRTLEVIKAYPCQALATQDDHLNVEMDPESELKVRQNIGNENLRVVGWYHSHPTFMPDPSFIDIENQLAYQTLFQGGDSDNNGNEKETENDKEENGDEANEKKSSKDKEEGAADVRDNEDGEKVELDGDQELPSKTTSTKTNMTAPFVGAIVGPFDPNLPRSVSAMNWFYVTTTDSKNSGDAGEPRRLALDIKEDSELPKDEADRLLELLNNYRNSPHRWVFKEAWKPSSTELRLTKMLVSLGYRMPWIRNNVNGNAEEESVNGDDKKISEDKVQDEDGDKGDQGDAVTKEKEDSLEKTATTAAAAADTNNTVVSSIDMIGNDYLLSQLRKELESW
ncbi:hypothetical protein H4219_005590 [Mycoemilia scoparia]|uniref:Myb-like, SWIRM and MPN domain-containing protein 1 n=1 Tax=Mycoemilia scoparia TaxID=417184 RepID=A0A9W7ZNQ4_9FUNG|nr:hypothetical protein H4219_005590 [Mycoemilia scoparia]